MSGRRTSTGDTQDVQSQCLFARLHVDTCIWRQDFQTEPQTTNKKKADSLSFFVSKSHFCFMSRKHFPRGCSVSCLGSLVGFTENAGSSTWVSQTEMQRSWSGVSESFPTLPPPFPLPSPYPSLIDTIYRAKWCSIGYRSNGRKHTKHPRTSALSFDFQLLGAATVAYWQEKWKVRASIYFTKPRW